MPIYHAKDNSFKQILGNNQLFVEFLKDFIPRTSSGMSDILKDISPEDIEDLKERFIPLFEEARDSDTVKRVSLKNHPPLFVIAIVEHESAVNFRSSFKMLQYITLVLDFYEKEANAADSGASLRKGFRYPPVLPVVFYDGTGPWTAETNFLKRTALNDVFEKYIPKFEYEVVSLNQYSPEELTRFNDVLSLVLLIDHIGTMERKNLLKELHPDYLERIALKIPKNMN
ncbi:MAG: Rpn family recombination-promoting nuclease/putative transposase, partial [Treponema sp.]|nr:Rpn family recombination-promoting nuclease/putative transposase [Treponema sp.]